LEGKKYMKLEVTPVDVLGLGHVCIDYISVLDPYPERGKKGTVVESLIIGGGPVPNALAAISLWGGSTRFCGKLGMGWEGEIVLNGLQERGVDCSCLKIDPDGVTARAHIWIDRHDGARTVALDLSRYNWMGADDFDDRLARNCRVFLSDGRMPDANIKALKAAKEAGVITVFDVGTPRARLDEMFPLLEYALLSYELASTYLPGATPQQFARWIVGKGARVGVVTAGEEGTYWSDGKRHGYCPAFTVSPVVDTTGAGDIFHAGFIWGLLHDWNADDTLRFASAAGGLACRKLSALASIPELAEVEEVVRQ